VEVGKKVTKFKPGDRVAALLPQIGSRWGASAEYATVEEMVMAKIPDSIGFESAASLPLVGLTAQIR
jgi:NADPH:quinone reductase-like Zn-dependent oxidoreductase